MAIDLLEPLRTSIVDRLRQTFAGPGPLRRYDEPAGAPGLYGSDSVVWKVHGNLPSMLVGGISALLLQTLHPLAMAGVSDHSDFRRDPMGRLRRTAAFIAITTFADRDSAYRTIDLVKKIHSSVVGRTPDGRLYEANDPELLTWVHTAEVASFLHAYQRLSRVPLRPVEIDRYFDEAAIVAELLGARAVPRTLLDVKRYFVTMQRELRAGEQAFETVEFLRQGPSRDPAERTIYDALFQTSVDLLPAWARSQLKLADAGIADAALKRPLGQLVLAALHWAHPIADPETQARRRTRIAEAA